MTLSDNEKRLIIATVSLVAGASTAKIYNCPDQTNITQCPLSLAMIAVAFLCSLMIGFSRLRGARAHRPFINLSHQQPPSPKRNNRLQEIKNTWRALDNNVQNLYTETKHQPQHENYNTMLPPV